MELNKLPKIVDKKKKIVGRGMGSGKGGHTTGRGNKGQKIRGRVKLGFEGTKTKKSFIKRLPFLRGKGKFKSWSEKVVIVKTGDLADWSEKMTVNLENLTKKGLVPAGTKRVKLLVGGKCEKKLKIEVEMSKSAKKMLATE